MIIDKFYAISIYNMKNLIILSFSLCLFVLAWLAALIWVILGDYSLIDALAIWYLILLLTVPCWFFGRAIREIFRRTKSMGVNYIYGNRTVATSPTTHPTQTFST